MALVLCLGLLATLARGCLHCHGNFSDKFSFYRHHVNLKSWWVGDIPVSGSLLADWSHDTMKELHLAIPAEISEAPGPGPTTHTRAPASNPALEPRPHPNSSPGLVSNSAPAGRPPTPLPDSDTNATSPGREPDPDPKPAPATHSNLQRDPALHPDPAPCSHPPLPPPPPSAPSARQAGPSGQSRVPEDGPALPGQDVLPRLLPQRAESDLPGPGAPHPKRHHRKPHRLSAPLRHLPLQDHLLHQLHRLPRGVLRLQLRVLESVGESRARSPPVHK